MRAVTPDMDAWTEQLTEVLDEQIQHLDRRRVQLKTLADTIVERDDRALETLLEEVERALDKQAELDRQLDLVRTRIANALLQPPDGLTLGAIVESMAEPARSRLAGRRRQLIEAVDAFSRQHLHTSVLLMESARLNRLMLEAVFPDSRGVTTYDPAGQDAWRPDTHLVDAER